MRWLGCSLVASLVLSCADGGDARLRIDTRAVQALRAELDLAAGLLGINCGDGRVIEVAVALDGLDQEVTVALPACGPAEVTLRIASVLGIPELLGEAQTRLVPGFVDVELPMRRVGQLSLKLADDVTSESCVATVERTAPDAEVIGDAIELRRDLVTTLLVPVGSYSVTCEGRAAVAVVTAGENIDAALEDPAPGPRLVATSIPANGYPYGTANVDIALTFSVPVQGLSQASVTLAGPAGGVTNVVVNQTVVTISISALTTGDYTLTLSNAITDIADGLPLVGAPLVLPFRVRANEFYVSTTGDDDLNDGLTPSTPWRNMFNVPLRGTTPATVYVAQGTYDEQIFIDTDGYFFEGGWNDTFTARDVVASETRVRAASQTVYFQGVGTGGIDGFTVEAIDGSQAVTLQSANVYIRNSLILGNFSSGISYGAFIEGNARPTIANNVIVIANGSSGRAIHLQQSGSARIIHNTLNAGNNAVATGIYINVDAASDISIVNNLFVGTTTTNTRTGINGSGGNPPAALLNNAFSSEHDGVYFNQFGGYTPLGTGDLGFTAPHRFGGNILVGQTSTLVDVDNKPLSTSLAVGIDSASATCGFDDVSLAYPCSGPTTDRAGRARTNPTTVGAFQL